MIYNSIKFKETLEKYKNILIIIKGSPDPDAIASSYAIKMICELLNIKSQIVATKKISLPQNKSLIQKLDIPVRITDTINDIQKFDSYIVVDFQSASVEGVTGKIPCAVHIDHHEPIEENIKVDFRLVRQDAGSASSIIALLFKELDLKFDKSVMKAVATSLMFGIETDTDKYTHIEKLDYEALRFLSNYSDKKIIKDLSSTPYSKETIILLWKALENIYLYKDWLIAGIGFIDEINRDSIAIIADYILKEEDVSTVIVFAAVEKKNGKGLMLDASFRSTDKDLPLNSIIKEITLNGGGRKYKGAYQVDLNYFSFTSNRDMLWDVIKETTMEILKERRDNIYITEIRGYYKNFKKKITDFFGN